MLNAHLLFTREAYPTSAYQSLANLAPAPPRKRRSRRPAGAFRRGSASAIRSQIIQAVKRWESIGVDQINFLLNSVECCPRSRCSRACACSPAK